MTYQVIGFTLRLCLAIVATVFGSAFQHGYNTGVVNSPKTIIEQWVNGTYYSRYSEYISPEGITGIWSVTVSIFCVGGMLGAMFTGMFSDKFGRKGGLLINNLFAIIGGILQGFSPLAGSYEMLIVGRFFCGVNCGLNAGLAPMYLTEISPIHLRGAIGSLYQLLVTISILISQVLGMRNVLGTAELWPYLLALTIAPAIFQLAVLPLCPESPRFTLINKDNEVAATQSLSWLRGTPEVQEEIEEMKAEHEAAKLTARVTLREIVTNPALRAPLIISVVMMLAQQLSGINAVIFFSTDIYKRAGLDEMQAQSATLGMGAMNVLMTVVSVILVEKAGRKTLQLIGLSGMFTTTVLLTLCLALKDQAHWLSYISIVLVIAFVVCFATGPGSIPWFLVSELFAQSARPTATSIAVAVNWTANFIVGVSFLPLANAMGPFVFLIFATVLAVSVIFTWKKVPETKNKPIDEITAMFRQQAYK
ncbi:solute carrier family 2, facilitated glucose transporter member 1-like isoform X3 [Amphibalanus amphitrite]|uniref:solute carrier family 2, facilitated glucose transporter member 1-like isoform X3 n=1 Tax=Amphibalanus amphitrite TaxID=1232801 RepID=UPI001C917A36|nr:solute carrier family 2, facilitated glucose transporter member 1-like isoform X3 [Amphibalanus amphitrite]